MPQVERMTSQPVPGRGAYTTRRSLYTGSNGELKKKRKKGSRALTNKKKIKNMNFDEVSSRRL